MCMKRKSVCLVENEEIFNRLDSIYGACGERLQKLVFDAIVIALAPTS